MYARILVPTDGSPCSDGAVVQSVAIAAAMGSRVVFLHVMDTVGVYHEGIEHLPETLRAMKTRGHEILERARKVAVEAGVSATVESLDGIPADEIVRRAAEFDLVVLGSHGKGILKKIFVGSVTGSVLHRVTCPVLVVR